MKKPRVAPYIGLEFCCSDPACKKIHLILGGGKDDIWTVAILEPDVQASIAARLFELMAFEGHA